MFEPLTDTGALSPEGVAKAKRAYGDSIAADFAKAREHLLSREGRLARCIKAMGITVPAAALRARIEGLRLAPSRGGKQPSRR